jgi:hypothetical protein
LPSLWWITWVQSNVYEDGMHFTQFVIVDSCFVVPKVKGREWQRCAFLCLLPISMEVLVGKRSVNSICLVNHKGALYDRNYTAMHTHVQWSVHLSALLITWFTWGDGLQRRYTSDVAFFASFVSLSQLIIVIWIKTSVGITTVFHTGISRAVAAA